jgi:hypothetical protein
VPAAPSLPLAFDQARLSPCAGCAAPCCTVLPVYDFDVRGLPDIDYALYLCNFERIELAINEVGGWRVHYRAPCRQLDPVERRCTVHGSPDQPRVCQKYDAHACFYTSIFSAAGSPRMVRMDRGRVLAWAAACAFGEDRALVAAPDPTGLLGWLPPLAPVQPGPIPDDGPHRTSHPRRWSELRAPCDACPAWCCQRLSFPHSRPENASQVDHLRFVLGFPGVEIQVDAHDAWSLVIRARCGHLLDEAGAGRCGIFGHPERPGVCQRFDALSCAYQERFSQARPPSVARFGFEAFPAVAETFVFGDGGHIVERPGFRELQAACGSFSSPQAAHR